MGQKQNNIYGAKRGLCCVFALLLLSASTSRTRGLRQKLRKMLSAQIPRYGRNAEPRPVSVPARTGACLQHSLRVGGDSEELVPNPPN